jgi:NTP pyrophosphatase (non-canonical NTP hydrolase)
MNESVRVPHNENVGFGEHSEHSDDAITVGALRAAVAAFVAERDWEQFHTPKNLAMSIAIEAAEIMEHFQWYGLEESALRLAQNDAERAGVADELADVLIYCLSFANAAGIDLSAAVLAKLDRNQERFPTAHVRGRLG